ncbi:MAG TPA: TadE/TadG family type IV pilus assembly protein [Methylocella sp.]|nr:TadE/TadG family type IV pilus assembly protein [Methylocella sp.]
MRLAKKLISELFFNHFAAASWKWAARFRTIAGQRAGVFLKDRKAAVAAEFALIAAPFIFSMMEIFQSALFVYYSASLNYATESAARQALVGSVQNGGLTATQFRTNLICPLLPSSMTCSNVIINVQGVPEALSPGGFYAFVSNNSIVIPPLNNSQTSFCPGTPGSYVYLQVFYPMPLIGPTWLPFVTTTYQGQSVKLVSAYAAFKLEPYQSTYTPPAGC